MEQNKNVIFNDDKNLVKINKKLKKVLNSLIVGDREYFYKQLDELLTKSGFYSSEMAPVVKRNIEVF